MTNYEDLPLIPVDQHELKRYVFNNEKPNGIDHQLTQVITDLIKQRGFKGYDSQCIPLLQTCLIDFYKDLVIRFKQHMESLGTSITIQDVFERTLSDVMSINLRELQCYMERKQ
ncbi:unnamed protein product [Rotaria magnacalcarata]|uniref:Uncharacterized protein n=1 Tax=Rotaria magnacalcarata TaxID=392030 RepID=A0A816V3K4_9BILA|nr:unnamed protein product [Rotaria magnacalcarata]CAF2224182.1 unnamed protein product [Rotaria magnacalcarata]CAF3819294.1 unnamed protein product [Rotaria magnacalcarata]CAF3861651.1 unnamed protein product [Rotaria magnacalcarata]